MVRDLWFRLRSLVRRRADERELDEEVAFHLEHHARALRERGYAPAEAMRRARAAFGSIDAVKEESREARGVHAVETTWQDLRYGVRALRRTPSFTVTALVTLTLTIGAATTVLTLVETLFFRLLPVGDPARLVEVRATRNHGAEPGFVSYPDYTSFRDRTRTLDSLAAHYSGAPFFVRLNGGAEQVDGAVVSANFFEVLEVEPVFGRLFHPDEDRVPDRDRVAVVSHEFWSTRLQSAESALGTELTINADTFTVVGVLRPGFNGLNTRPSQIYIPTMMLGTGYRFCEDAFAVDCTILEMIGRRSRETSLSRVAAEMATHVPSRWHTAGPGENSGIAVRVPRGVGGGEANLLLSRILMVAVALLVVVCGANLSGLLLARNDARVRELVIRASLGASRARLARQLVTESLALSVAGGLCGLILSVWLTGALEAAFYAVDAQGRAVHLGLTLRPAVAGAIAMLSVLIGVAVGAVPALRAARAGAGERLKRDAPAASARAGVSRGLLGAQVALAVTLVAVSVLLAASARAVVADVDPDVSRVALLRLRPRLAGYEPTRAQAFLREVVDRLESSSTVESVSFVGTGAPLRGLDARVALPGAPDTTVSVGHLEVSPRYFDTLGMSVLQGRDFDARDRAGAEPVAIVSRTLGRRLWPDEPAVGSMLLADGRPHRVVGVVEDVSLQARNEPVKPYVYLPIWQNADRVDARVQVRTTGDAAGVLPQLVQEVHQIDPAVPVTETMTLPAQLAGWFRPVRMGATLVSYAGLLAALISGIGLYGALAFAVTRRTREIGVRKAIGAAPATIVRMFAGDGLRIVGPGVIAGIALAVVSSRLVEHMLYGAAASDALGLAAAGAVVGGIGMLACWLPARRAARIQPTLALRHE